MFSLLVATILQLQQGQQVAPSKALSIVIAVQEDKAEEFSHTLAKRAVDQTEAQAAGFFREELEQAWLYLDKGLVEDRTITNIEKVIDQWIAGKLPANQYWGSLGEEEKKMYASLLSQGFSGRTRGSLEKRLANPNIRLAYHVEVSVERKNGAPLSGLLESESNRAVAGTPKLEKTPVALEKGRTMSIHLSRGFPRKLEGEVLSQAIKRLDELRAKRLESARSKLQKEAWKRFQRQQSAVGNWDGQKPIRFGDLDPILKAQLLRNAMGETIKEGEMVGPIKFNFFIGFAEGDSASVNGLFTAYR